MNIARVQNHNSTMNVHNSLEHRLQWASGMLPKNPRKIGSGEKVVKASLKNWLGKGGNFDLFPQGTHTLEHFC